MHVPWHLKTPTTERQIPTYCTLENPIYETTLHLAEITALEIVPHAVGRAAANAAHVEMTRFIDIQSLNAVNKQLNKVLNLNGFLTLSDLPEICALVKDSLDGFSLFDTLSDFWRWAYVGEAIEQGPVASRRFPRIQRGKIGDAFPGVILKTKR